MHATGRPWDEIEDMGFDRILALYRYWKKAPPVNELVRNFFEINDSDGFDELLAAYPTGEIQ